MVGAADGGSGDAAERLARELDEPQLCTHVWLHSPASAGGLGGGGAARCAVVRRKVLRSLAGEAGLAAKVEGFSEYLDRRIRPGPQANREALRWACVAVGLAADALDGPLDEGAHAALSLFDLVTFQRLPPADPSAAVLPTAQVPPPLPPPGLESSACQPFSSFCFLLPWFHCTAARQHARCQCAVENWCMLSPLVLVSANIAVVCVPHPIKACSVDQNCSLPAETAGAREALATQMV